MCKPDTEAALAEHGDSLYRIALGMLRSAQDAEDAVMEAMLRHLKNPRGFRSPEHEKAWLITVTLNICRDMLRRREKRAHLPLEALDEPPCEDSGDVLALLAELPPESRQVLILHYIEGYSVRETAKLLGLGESAVKMRLKSARERFKLIYEGEN